MSKEDFLKVWKDTSRENILNQFYYEHKTLREQYDSIEEILSMVSTIEHNLEKYEEVGLDHFEYALKKTRELKDYVIETLESDK